MKTIVLFAGLICAFCPFQATTATPTDELTTVQPDEAQFEAVLEAEPAVESHRQKQGPVAVPGQKRATCDLLSGTGINHSAWAALCLLRGNRGGYCSGKAVCICRK